MNEVTVDKIDQTREIDFLVGQLIKLASEYETFTKDESKGEVLHAMQTINKYLETISGTPYLVKVGESKWNSKR